MMTILGKASPSLVLWGGWPDLAARSQPFGQGMRVERGPSRDKATTVSALLAQRPRESSFEFWQIHTLV